MSYRTASVEIIDDASGHECELCPRASFQGPAEAKYNVFDGNGAVYVCGHHLTKAVHAVATRK